MYIFFLYFASSKGQILRQCQLAYLYLLYAFKHRTLPKCIFLISPDLVSCSINFTVAINISSGVIFYYLTDFYSSHGSDQQKWNECIISDYTRHINLFQGIAF